MQAVNMEDQLVLAGPASEVKTEHLIRPFGWGTAYPQTDQQTGNNRDIHLHRDPIGPLTEQVPAPQHAFHPTEKEFYRPPISISQGDQLRLQVQPIGDPA